MEMEGPQVYSPVFKTVTTFVFRGNKCYNNYDVACTACTLLAVELRRERLCIKFAKKDLNSQRSIFTKTKQTANTR